MKKAIFYILFLAMAFYTKASNNDSTQIVYQFNIKSEIAPAIWRQTQKAFAHADSIDASLILIHMNTYGGTVVDADSIRTKIINSKRPVYVFIDNNAASAGALISIACDRIYMSPGANIGAATVVNQSGEKAPDKYQSYFRSTMRSTAQTHGKDTIINGNDTIFRWKRDPIMAEAMVDESVYIEGVIDTGKILTFTTDEAIKYHFCEGKAESIEEVLEKAEITNYKIVKYEPTLLDIIIGFLSHPIVSGILIMGILGGIYFEMQSPGIGFPLIIAITAAVAYFAPLYLEGLAENWEIIIFVVGLILIALEIFVIPGFGLAGASGIMLSITGLVLSLIGNVRFNFENVETSSIVVALLTVTIAITVGFILSIWLSQKLFTANRGILQGLALESSESRSEGFIGIDQKQISLVGQQGITHTVLRPSGKIIIKNDVWDAISEEGFIDKDTPIIVVKQEATQVYVMQASSKA